MKIGWRVSHRNIGKLKTFTFVLLNRGVPDVETMFCIRTKERELFAEITRCVSDHETWLMYVSFFLENKNRKQKSFS